MIQKIHGKSLVKRPLWHVRSFHLSRPFFLDAASVRAYINQEIVESKEPSVKESVTLKALSDCNKLETLYRASSSIDSPLAEQPVEESHALLKNVTEDPKVFLTTSLLHQFMTLKPAPSSQSSIILLESFFKKNPKKPVSESLAMIPFRRAAYNGEYEDALKLIDLTVAGPQFQSKITKRLRRYFAYWATGVSAILGGVESLLQSGIVGTWESTGMILGMVFTYLSATTLFAVLATSSRSSGSGETLQWIQGTTATHRYRHAVEMKMASLLADLNRSLPENQNECSLALARELAKRSMAVVELDQESMSKEYWARSGSGFEWVEPDQDPAEILWRRKVDAERSKRIGSPFARARDQEEYSWAEDTMPKTLPHASLIDTGPKRLPAV